MSHSQFHCTSRAYLDMHGLIFETSICYWQDQPGRSASEDRDPGDTGEGRRGEGRGRKAPAEEAALGGHGPQGATERPFFFPTHPFFLLSLPPFTVAPGEPGKRSHRAWTERREIPRAGTAVPQTTPQGAARAARADGRGGGGGGGGPEPGRPPVGKPRRDTTVEPPRDGRALPTRHTGPTGHVAKPRRRPRARIASERVRGRDGPPTTTRRARRNAGDTRDIP